MQKISKLFSLICILTITGSLFAAPAVISKIPAGTMGYVAVNNINATSIRIEKLLTNIGIGQMMGLGMTETQPGQRGMLCEMLVGQAGLGDGFDAFGGFAMVFLDPVEMGIDISSATQPGKPDLAKLPMVIFLPGTDIDTLFMDREIAKDDISGFTRYTKEGDSMLAVQGEGYVMMSSNADALKKIQTMTKKSAAEELNAEEKKLVERNGLVYHINVAKARPIIMSLIKQAKLDDIDIMDDDDDDDLGDDDDNDIMDKLMPIYISMYEKMFEQFESITAGVTLADQGLVIEEITTATADSITGKALIKQSATTVNAEQLLNALPSTPYAIAFGSGITSDKELKTNMTNEFMQEMLSDAQLSPENKQQLLALASEFESQVNSIQFVVGKPVEDKGLFGMACVLKCDDSSKLLEMAKTKTDVINKIATESEEGEKTDVTLAYKAGVAKVGKVSIDQMEFVCPELTTNPAKLSEVKTILGEDKIRILLAAPDLNTVVITFGSSTDYMSTAINASKGSKALTGDLQKALALPFMPKKPHSVGMVNFKNTIDLALDAVRKLKPETADTIPQLMLTCEKPITFASQNKGLSVHSVTHVPNEVFTDLFQIGMTLMMSGMGGGMGGGQMPFGNF